MEDFSEIRVKIALMFGADPNILTKIANSYPLVTRAARSGHAGILRRLLESGGDPRTGEEYSRYQPIHMAAAKGMHECIEALIEHGADPNARYIYDMDGTPLMKPPGATALYLAEIHGKKKCIDVLLSLGANPSRIGPNGESLPDG